MWLRSWTVLTLLAVVAGAGACARPRRTGHGTHPDQMSAEDHRRAAVRHGDIARQGPYLTRGSWAPWTYSWDSGNGHLEERDAHLAAADVLDDRYREACVGLSVGAEATAPIARHARSATPIDRGVMLALDPAAGAPEDVLAAIRCHHAWLALEDRPGGAGGVEALEGLRYSVQARGERLELSITAPTPDLVEELRRRARAAVAGVVREP